MISFFGTKIEYVILFSTLHLFAQNKLFQKYFLHAFRSAVKVTVLLSPREDVRAH